MAYDFFPESVEKLQEGIKTFPTDVQAEIVGMYRYLSDKHGTKTPINIDKAKPRNVNISRSLAEDTTIPLIKSNAKLQKVNIKFGNGSSGNRGVNNRGNLFEPQFAEALLKWWAGEIITDTAMKNAIEHLDKTYNIRSSSKFKVDIVGGENTRRPLRFGPPIELTNPKGQGYDVGQSVTDITLHTDNGPIFLSLKLGATVTFFNVGVRTVLTPQEIKAKKITNNNGLQILKLFNLDHDKFCDVFNQEYTPTASDPFMVRTTNFDRTGLKKLLQSGVGYGYHVIHKIRGSILSKKMDQEAMRKSAEPQSLTIFYGGRTGRGRRVDMVVETPSYIMQLNIRDTQGADGYPTRMMCNFTTK
jgi:hypothetical protein